jgi:hypothetical protein
LAASADGLLPALSVLGHVVMMSLDAPQGGPNVPAITL